MLGRIGTTILLAGTAVFLSANSGFAQKSKDTLRVGFSDPIRLVDIIYAPTPDTSFTSRAVYDSLIYYDDFNREFRPLLAESWKRIDDRIIEFKLRKNIKFHDGSEFDADDVVYTLNFLKNPKYKFRFKGPRFGWMKEIVKIDKYTVRVVSKGPKAIALMRLAKSIPIYPSDVHGALKTKSDFGKNPVGTGPYRVTQVDSNKGVIMVRNENFISPGPWRPRPSIGRIHAFPIPDTQTQIAQLITGGLDIIRDVPKDQTLALAKNPNLSVTVSSGLLMVYMAIDSVGKSGHPALKKEKVREAMMMAIDRHSLVKNIIPGGEGAVVMDAMCMRFMVGCDFSTTPPAFNPAKAKKLLAEAGFANGFDLVISATAAVRQIAEAAANFLRDIGVRADVNVLTFPAYRKRQRSGKIQVLLHFWTAGGIPDAESTLGFFMAKGARNYYGNERVTSLRGKAAGMYDVAKRKVLYREAYDLINRHKYILPISTLPSVFIHSKELEIQKGSLDTWGAIPTHMKWK